MPAPVDAALFGRAPGGWDGGVPLAWCPLRLRERRMSAWAGHGRRRRVRGRGGWRAGDGGSAAGLGRTVAHRGGERSAERGAERPRPDALAPATSAPDAAPARAADQPTADATSRGDVGAALRALVPHTARQLHTSPRTPSGRASLPPSLPSCSQASRGSQRRVLRRQLPRPVRSAHPESCGPGLPRNDARTRQASVSSPRTCPLE